MDVGSGYITDHKAPIKHLVRARQVCFNMPQEHVLSLARTWACVRTAVLMGLDYPYSLLPTLPQRDASWFFLLQN